MTQPNELGLDKARKALFDTVYGKMTNDAQLAQRITDEYIVRVMLDIVSNNMAKANFLQNIDLGKVSVN